MIRKIKEQFIKLFKRTKKEKKKILDKSQKKKGLFDDIQIGDIVIAKMPLTEENLQHVPEGHRIRPYYISYVNENHFLAYPSFSKPRKYIDPLHSYYINQYLYSGLESDCYLDLKKEYVLPKENVYKYVLSVKDNDYNQIQRRLYFADRDHYISLYKEKPLMSEPSTGDVIKTKRNKYIIVDIDEKYYIALCAYPFTSNNPRGSIYVHLDGNPYYVHPRMIGKFKKSQYEIVDVLNTSEKQDVIREYNKYLKKHKKKG